MAPSKDDEAEAAVEAEEIAQSTRTRKRKQSEQDKKTTKGRKEKAPAECFLIKEDDQKNEEGSKKPKQKKKKKISDVLATSAPKPATPANLQKLLLKHFEDKRSVIEMEDLHLPDSCFLPNNDLTHSLSSYLKEVCPKWAKLCKNHKEKKSLLMVIVCSSAHRALELIRLLTPFRGKCKVLKLFAKHIKIEEQKNLLDKGVSHLGVGTPGRIKALIEQDALNLQSLKYLIFDWNWRDQKLRRMMDIPEVKQEAIKLLESGIIPACKAQDVKLGLF
ncbi:protein CMSS1 isoform X2 [Latimeria chalumnae]|uniref:protein CMSS1 isoform X2 n=1 Tax=Latimeria chalumnae TaxID=7897 RepID=UPI0006D8F1C1|nr:PREDICTED: protein CMSS1 [Latimeria chalumnae]|eukprot:XP_006009006.2 PREDICTED: protein CMSS1 [Latimeria chalumnae]